MNSSSIRRVALLGCDDQVLKLVSRGVAQGRIAISAAIDAPESHRAALRQWAPETPFIDQWEEILDGQSVDVAIFAEPAEFFLELSERRTEQLKKAAAAGIDLVLFHPACDGMLGYELEMARSTSRGRILTLCPEIRHPIFRRLQEELQRLEPSHRVEQVIVERSAGAARRTNILRDFVKDAMLLRELFGVPGRLSANGPAPDSDDWSHLAILLNVPNGPNIRWNIDPTGAIEGSRMTIITSAGRMLVALDREGRVGEFTRDGQTESLTDEDAWADDVWTQLQSPRDESAVQEDPIWLGACRDLDLAHAARRSVARGRMVELQVDRATEAANFKGVMSAWGCLLLLGVFLFFVVWSVVGALELTWTSGPPDVPAAAGPNRPTIQTNLSWRYLPIFFLAIALLGFLALQFLQLIIKPETKKAPEEEAPPTP